MLCQIRVLALLLASAVSAGAQDLLHVEFVQVQSSDLTFDTTLTGTVNATETVDLGFRAGGRITEVMVREGDTVEQGQILATIDPLQQQQELRVAKAVVASAEASAAQARQAMDRAEAMLERGVGTRAAADANKQALSAALGQLTQARSSLSQAQRALDDTALRAPGSGIITARTGEPGQIVPAAHAVFSLASTMGREVAFRAPDSPLLRRALGVPVSVTALNDPALRMTAKVSEISPLVDPSTGSVNVKARISDPPPDASLLGTAVRVDVHYPAGRGIAIPWTALATQSGQPAVWVVGDDATVSTVPIQIERYSDGKAIISKGLTAGQIVVGAGSQLLYPGRKVAPADRVTP